ncbi:MAG: NAD-dependent dehydratase [Ignavibacteriales bacterium CG18_big_fil_WC_8_21_14_2_50_31_20]|nr:MAG: NAD-dependent dehydratase [Ignavibacteriales bacterium CG18_big_fil_WC_8_21_14_2_50_31_20]
MKVLFIGGTGIISAAVSELCIKKGIDLYLFNRGLNTEFINKNAKLIQGDISNREDMKSLLKDETFDVVVDWLAFTPEDIKFDIELFKNKTKQFVFISSASVYQKPLSNYLVTEKTPISNPYWKYARNKIACEELLVNEYNKEGFPVTIVRPSFTYGETLIPAAITNNKKPMTLINRIKTGKKVIVHGDGSSLWVMTHNSDFAKGFVGLLGNEKAIGETFHITSDEVLTWNQIFRTIGKVIGVEPNIIHIPTDFINTYAPQIGEGLLGDKATSVVFDNSKIKNFVPEFNCTVKYEEGIRKSLNWLELHPKYCEIDNENNQIIDMIIAKYETAFEQ